MAERATRVRAGPRPMGFHVKTLEHVAQQARPYPSEKLVGCSTGLVLFAAAFAGHNDAIHFAEAGIETTCVDLDHERLAAMARIYPSSWKFHVDDAWRYAEDALANGETFDAVSVDTFTGDAERRSIESLDLWTSIANRLVTATFTGGFFELPYGWRDSLVERATGVYWLVLERDA